MITLALDASTYTGDVGGDRRRPVVAEQSTAMKGADEERLMPAVARVLEMAHVAAAIDRPHRLRLGAGKLHESPHRRRHRKGHGDRTRQASFRGAVDGARAGRRERRARDGISSTIDALRGELYVGLYDVDAVHAIAEIEPARLIAISELPRLAEEFDAKVVSPSRIDNAIVALPRAAAAAKLEHMIASSGPVNIDSWEPSYGRLAEAQVKWESAHGRPLPAK